jgi:hypothetical protein
MSVFRYTAVLCAAALVAFALSVPSSLSAQSGSSVRIPPPGSMFLVQGVIDTREPGAPLLHSLQGGRTDRNVRWMIVGGGLLLGGAIIGDDVGTIVSVTGLVIGGIGLYRFLQ